MRRVASIKMGRGISCRSTRSKQASSRASPPVAWSRRRQKGRSTCGGIQQIRRSMTSCSSVDRKTCSVAATAANCSWRGPKRQSSLRVRRQTSADTAASARGGRASGASIAPSEPCATSQRRVQLSSLTGCSKCRASSASETAPIRPLPSPPAAPARAEPLSLPCPAGSACSPGGCSQPSEAAAVSGSGAQPGARSKRAQAASSASSRLREWCSADSHSVHVSARTPSICQPSLARATR